MNNKKISVVARFSSNWCRSKMFAQHVAYIPCYLEHEALLKKRTSRGEPPIASSSFLGLHSKLGDKTRATAIQRKHGAPTQNSQDHSFHPSFCKAVVTSTDFGRGWPHPELLQGELPQQLAESFQHGAGAGGVFRTNVTEFDGVSWLAKYDHV